ncbi:hypothetical protein KR94_18305 [Pantoea ananatis]|nr:hypothetical protein KR94_18305 [Pantoea ananatis]
MQSDNLQKTATEAVIIDDRAGLIVSTHRPISRKPKKGGKRAASGDHNLTVQENIRISKSDITILVLHA